MMELISNLMALAIGVGIVMVVLTIVDTIRDINDEIDPDDYRDY
jgi:hypothetical protein